MKQSNNSTISSGYLLIELIIAISVLMIGLVGFMSLISRSTSVNRVISDQLTADYLASEGIEITKNLIDSNIIKKQPWNSGFSGEKCFEVDYKAASASDFASVVCPDNSINPLKLNSNAGTYSYGAGQLTPFYRTVHITPVGDYEIKVNSTVKWTGRGGTKNTVNLEDHFFNWRP